MQERLQKIIARAGIASRRHAEQLILSGQVRVNGRAVTELGSKADLATDRIYRLMIAQRVLHRNLVPINDDQGQPVKHTPEFITQLFDQELERLLSSLPANANPEEADRFRRAREISEAMIVNAEFNPA